MKRFQTEYSENSITYWPVYEAGRTGILFFIVLGTLFVATSIWVLLDNPSRGTRLGTLAALSIVAVALYAIIRLISRVMDTKIIVSTKGIVCFKGDASIEEQISWENVSAVYFAQDSWYGRKSCRIHLKKASSSELHINDPCDFVLPVSSVDEKKLLQFVPSHLWKNDPWYP